jgi:phosphate transport system substrate-binding protein
MKWSDIRPNWPDRDVHLFGPGLDSGTYDYFTRAVNGAEGVGREDYTASQDNNILADGIGRDELALGYFGLSYYEENKNILKLVPIDNDNSGTRTGPVEPSIETVFNGTYQPLSRPLFIYANVEHLNRPEVATFVDYYLKNASRIAGEVHYVPLPDRAYTLALQRCHERMTGSIFNGQGSQVGFRIQQLVQLEEALIHP